MEVILLQKVANLGGIGDRVKVRPGFARNFLLPQGKATMATPANIAKFEARRAELERVAQDELQAAQQRAEKMHDLKLTLTAKNRKNEDLTITINLAGFTAVYDGEAALTFDEFSKNASGEAALEKILQDRAEAARQKLSSEEPAPAPAQ